MENTNEYMTKEKIEAIVAKRVFGLYYDDEWSGLIFSIRRVHSKRQFKHRETNDIKRAFLKCNLFFFFASRLVY
jgi:hypothetical protein